MGRSQSPSSQAAGMPRSRHVEVSPPPGSRPLRAAARFAPIPVDAYAARLQAVCGAFSVEPAARREATVEGDITLLSAGGIDTAIVSLDAQSVGRTARMIRQDPAEHLFLLLQDSGTSGIRQGDQEVRLRAGDLYLADSACPSEFIYNGRRSRQISLHLPRDLARRRLGETCLGGVGLDRTDPLCVALRAVVTKLLSLEVPAQSSLGETVLDLLGAYFHHWDRQSAPQDRQRESLYTEACRLISRHACEPGLDIDSLASRLGLSRRSLQRHFEAMGETVSAVILRTRLDLAHRRLLARQDGEDLSSIAAIAYDTGFNDLSHFYRTFRTRFGTAPGAVRG